MNESLRRFSFAIYAVAIFFILSPLLDIATNAWPWVPSNEQWRFGLAGITANYLVSCVFGAVLATMVAAANESRKLLRTFGLLLVFSAVVLAIMLLGLLLDAVQVAGVVRPEELAMFRIGAWKAGFKIGAVSGLSVLLAIACFRAARSVAARPEKEGPHALVRSA